jgi:uracil-DNA glycosylase
MDVKIEPGWKSRLKTEFEKDYFTRLTDFIKEEYRKATIYPPGALIFNAFDICPFDTVKAVILGQDPYHGPGQAHGLCFQSGAGRISAEPDKYIQEIESDLEYHDHYQETLPGGQGREYF